MPMSPNSRPAFSAATIRSEPLKWLPSRAITNRVTMRSTATCGGRRPRSERGGMRGACGAGAGAAAGPAAAGAGGAEAFEFLAQADIQLALLRLRFVGQCMVSGAEGKAVLVARFAQRGLAAFAAMRA